MKRFRAIPPRVRYLSIAIVTALFIVAGGLWIELQNDPVHNAPAAVSASSEPISPTTPKQQSFPVPFVPENPKPPASPSVAPTPSSPSAISAERKPQGSATLTPQVSVKTLYGHLPYQENQTAQLVSVGQYVRGSYERAESLDVEAARAFEQMVSAAKAANVVLMPISGFRTIADQTALFTRQVERRGSVEAAAQLSAPPGYSEHHTGYAIDIADEQQSETDLKYSFQDTNAYRWLSANAYKFGFEQSFPQNNWQGVSYEPWHWRYVLPPRASQVFAIAKGNEVAN